MILRKGELVYVPAGVTLRQDDPESIGIVKNHVCLEEPKYLLCLGAVDPRVKYDRRIFVMYQNAKWLAHERDIYIVHEREERNDC